MKRARITASKKWVFTLNNWNEEQYGWIGRQFDELADRWVIGKEIGETGTRHLQGWVVFKKATRPIETIGIKEIHWEKQRGSELAAAEYCRKDGDFVEHNAPKAAPKLKDPLEGKELREWQKMVLKLIEEEPDDRTIHWIYDKNGNTGKTTLAKHICMFYKNSIYLSGKASDVKYAIGQAIENNNTPTICLFDFTRSTENYISYEALESVKNGIFFSGKYEGKMYVFNCPHVIVMANFRPDWEKLSQDRWRFYDVTDKSLEEDMVEV